MFLESNTMANSSMPESWAKGPLHAITVRGAGGRFGLCAGAAASVAGSAAACRGRRDADPPGSVTAPGIAGCICEGAS